MNKIDFTLYFFQEVNYFQSDNSNQKEFSAAKNDWTVLFFNVAAKGIENYIYNRIEVYSFV